MSVTLQREYCQSCTEPLDLDGKCFNVNCTTAQAEATADAARTTAKATAGAYDPSQDAPRAWSPRGNVD